MRNLCVILAFFVSIASTRAIADGPPNVVFILTDNHGAWTLGCYGNKDIRTPNIDRLANEGTLFTRAFASNPVCSPTRATLLTGLIPSQHGVHSFLRGGNLQTGPNARCTLDEFTSLPEILTTAGYDCGLVGKWHLGDNLSPQENLDDYWITMPHGGTSTFYNAQVIQDGRIRTEPTYLTDFWTQHAVRFIDQQAQRTEKPFFLFLSYNGPYALSRLLLRQGQNRHADHYAKQALNSFPRTKPHAWQLNNLDYINNPTSIQRVATEVSGVDDGVGEIMRALKTHGLDENTIVVFAADQGWVGGHGGFFGMGDHTRPLTARDGMMQIPLIWRHPGKVAAGKRVDSLFANYDFLPTLLGHLGMSDRIPNQPVLPGRDFSSQLADPSPKPGRPTLIPMSDEAVFYEFENLRCIRTETHKYVHRHPNGPHELYDLMKDPDEFVNLVNNPNDQTIRDQLHGRLDAFYSKYATPQYDLWQAGISQVHLHDGIDEEVAQLTSVAPPALPDNFQPAPLTLPDGYSAELIAGPPLVTHPTMGCFDDEGNLYVCNNAGVNRTNEELETELPNEIRRLVDSDGDGRFESYTVFADKMTFPMGGTWRDGSLYVASPPNIWKLTDTDADGVADEREVIVSQFGYNGNAASIHGCFSGPDGRLYWTDGYHGHEFKDAAGNVSSKREGSYLFSCRTDGSDKRIHCGGGMDNPVEIDFTESGDMLGTVNILYSRPRVDCLVHWLHGGAYPHRERVLREIQVTGDLLGPVHRFGHVAVSGMTRYRSGVMDHRFRNDLFATFFNSGKVVRLSLSPHGSTYETTQHEFLSSTSREFHPTDVIEDADGSLLVIDTGGWFYRGCPTSQYAKPQWLGGIYRIKRDGMTPMVDPRGNRINWNTQTVDALIKLFNDTRHVVRQRAVDQSVDKGSTAIAPLVRALNRGDVRVRQHAVWTLARLLQSPGQQAVAEALAIALSDPVADVRQAASFALSFNSNPDVTQTLASLLSDSDARVRRQTATSLGIIGDPKQLETLLKALERVEMDRSEDHALVFAIMQIGDAKALRQALDRRLDAEINPRVLRGLLIALDQTKDSELDFADVMVGLDSEDSLTARQAVEIASRHPEWAEQIEQRLRTQWPDPANKADAAKSPVSDHQQSVNLLSKFIGQPGVSKWVGEMLSREDLSSDAMKIAVVAIRNAGQVEPDPSWIAPLQRRLAGSDEATLSETIATVRGLRGNHFSQQLTRIHDTQTLPMLLRVEAVAALAMHEKSLQDSTLDKLLEICNDGGSPQGADRAIEAIAQAKVSSKQLARVISLLPQASPSQLRLLIGLFARGLDQELAERFLDALTEADSLNSLSESEVSDVIKRFPAETLARGNQILDQLKANGQNRLLRLESLRARISEGAPGRGRQVFFSEKAKCSGCHRVGETGKAVGPDLTSIGANRSSSDLLESIVFPSASIVRDYGTYKVLTTDGRVYTGLLANESQTGLELQVANGERVSIRHGDIEQISPSAVSTMPAGLDEALSEQELLDVVNYLLEQR